MYNKLQGGALRAAINSPIQGSAADVAMCAMIRIHGSEELRRLGWKLLLQVHDEVILEGPESSSQEVLELTRQLLVGVARRLQRQVAAVPVCHVACQLSALGAGSWGSQLAAGTASQLARWPCWMRRGARGPVPACGGRGWLLWQRAGAVSPA